jgi:hypothetical protein
LARQALPQMPNLNPISASKGFVIISEWWSLLAIVLEYSYSKEHKMDTLRRLKYPEVFQGTHS